MKITRGVDDFMPFTVTFDRREELALLAGLIGPTTRKDRAALKGADQSAADDFYDLYIAACRHLGGSSDC